MLIRTKIRYSVLFVLTVGVTLIIALYVSQREVRSIFDAETITVNISDELSELLLVSEDYFSFANKRALVQWNLRRAKVVDLLVQAENNSKLNSGKIYLLRQKLNHTDSIMSRLKKFNLNKPNDSRIGHRLQEAMAARIREEIRLSLEIAISLSHSIRNQLEENFTLSRYLSFIVVVFVMVISILLGRWVYLKVLWPVDELRRDARYLREGKFNQRINSRSHDEIGQLANDFDAMAGELEKTMISRNELEDIVNDRTNQLRLAKDAAESANAAKNVFLSRVSHELRTPLNAILGFSQLLQMDKNITDQNKQNIDLIYSSGKHLLTLINEVLEISRIEQGEMTVTFIAVNVKTLIQEVITMAAVQAEDKNVKINNTIQDDVIVRADQSRLKQILINFLSNAIKYNHDGGQVTIFLAESKQGRIDICFKDTGIGIKKEKQDKVFVPFERLLDDKYSIEGVGIGLALSYKLAELMGGKIGFDSEFGQGSTFWISLELME